VYWIGTVSVFPAKDSLCQFDKMKLRDEVSNMGDPLELATSALTALPEPSNVTEIITVPEMCISLARTG